MPSPSVCPNPFTPVKKFWTKSQKILDRNMLFHCKFCFLTQDQKVVFNPKTKWIDPKSF